MKLSLLLFTVLAAIAVAVPDLRVHKVGSNGILIPDALSTRDAEMRAMASGGDLFPRANKHKVLVKMGNNKQNVGDLLGSSLYSAVWHAIDDLCPRAPGNSSCHQEHGYPFTKSIPVNYRKGEEVKVGSMELFVRGGWYGKNDPLRKLMIGTIAGVVERMSLDEKNCYKFGDNKHFCNIADYVEVVAPDGNYIQVYFDNKTKEGHFDCVAIKEAGLKSMMRLNKEYNDALARGGVDMSIECLRKEVT